MNNLLKHFAGEQWLCDPDQLRSTLALVTSGERAAATISAGSNVNSYEEFPDYTLIRIDGLMVPQASPLADLFSYAIAERIQENILRADARGLPCGFRFTSPGGMVEQVSETADYIYCMDVPTFGYAASRAQSAAFWLFSQCDKRYANETAQLGCVGVCGASVDNTNNSVIVSQYAKNKLGSREDSQNRVNQIEGFFHNALSRGTGLSVSEVIEATDEGATFLAGAAQERNLIHGVTNFQELITTMNFSRLQKAPSTQPVQSAPQQTAARSTARTSTSTMSATAAGKQAGKISVQKHFNTVMGSPFAKHQKTYASQLACDATLTTDQCLAKLKASQPKVIENLNMTSSAQGAADRYAQRKGLSASGPQPTAQQPVHHVKPKSHESAASNDGDMKASAKAAADRYAARKGLSG